MSFIPNSMLLNNIYLPFYNSPTIELLNAKDHLSIETGTNGLNSTINLIKDNQSIIPFLDLSKYDSETKDWFWYDEEGFPLRIYWDDENEYWYLKSLYSFSRLGTSKLRINPTNLQRDNSLAGKILGWFTLVIEVDDNIIEDTIKMYTGKPIIVSIGNQPLIDNTDYSHYSNNINLSNYQTNANPEFYYDFIYNKIYTNQNLTSNPLETIQVHCFKNIDNFKVKILMGGNAGMTNFVTPTIDYYIAKLHGQYLKD